MKRCAGTQVSGKGLAARIAWLSLSVLVTIGMQALSMIHGWGLRPESWRWIIGAGFFGVLFAKAMLSVAVYACKVPRDQRHLR
jgi:hypothetical protein